jgi:hypothetical protein
MPMRASEKEIFSTMMNGTRKNSSSQKYGTAATRVRPVGRQRRGV